MPYPEIMVFDSRCIRCGKCAGICALDAISIGDMRKMDRSRCDLCLKCIPVCPTGAIKVVGRWLTVDEVMSEVKRDELFYQNSGGGVTVSGGEPLMQWRFVLNLLKECRREAINTVLDTCGYASWKDLSNVLEYVDLCLYDVKQMDPESHRRVTGKSNRRIIRNLHLTAARVRTWLRMPLIPGYNDSDENILKVARLAQESRVEKVSLLPYHPYGEAKYQQLGRHDRPGDLVTPSSESVQHICEIFRNNGINATVGY